jgi:tetratricopeptide (TPR) repeat protein
VPYAVFRKARSLHLDEKRFEAVRAYEEVLDYWPNAINYASGALYYSGLANWQNGDEEKAMRDWKEMAQDVDYSQHPLAGDAKLRLAGYLQRKGDVKNAFIYYNEVAIDFRWKAPGAADEAIRRVWPTFIARKDEAGLRAFYRKVGTFGRYREVPEDLSNDRRYWDTVCDGVNRRARDLERSAKKDEKKAIEELEAFYRYWVGVADGRFQDSDDYQLTMIRWYNVFEKSPAKHIERMDALFKANEKPDDWNRIIRWISLMVPYKQKAMEYYQMLDFKRLSYGHILSVMKLLYERINEPAVARGVFERIKFDQLTDEQLADLASYFSRRDTEIMFMLYDRIRDREFAQMCLLRYFEGKKDLEKALPLADALQSCPTFAEEAIWIKAGMLKQARRYEDALTAYRQSNRLPDAIWKISECYVGLGKLDLAIERLREIENFFAGSAPEAAMRIASLYRSHKQKKSYVAQLRYVMKKYPKTRQSSAAHQALEDMDVDSGGGTDAD